MQKEERDRKELLDRIRALMARTVANGCTEAEAQQATEMVDRLVAKYEIDLTEASVEDQEVVRMDIKLEAHSVRYAALRLAEFCDCKVWTDGPFLSFLGLSIDTEIAEYLLLLFQRAIDREVATYSMLNGDFAMQDANGQRQMSHSFAVGMATRLGERLTLLKSNRDLSRKTGGFDLVLAKQSLVKDAFDSLGISLGRDHRGRSIAHRGAYAAGQSAADSVSINPGMRGSAGGGSGRIR